MSFILEYQEATSTQYTKVTEGTMPLVQIATFRLMGAYHQTLNSLIYYLYIIIHRIVSEDDDLRAK